MERPRVPGETCTKQNLIPEIFSPDFVTEDIFIASKKAASELVASPLCSDIFDAGYRAVKHLEATHPEELETDAEAIASRVAEVMRAATEIQAGCPINRYKRTRIHEAFWEYLSQRETEVFTEQGAD